MLVTEFSSRHEASLAAANTIAAAIASQLEASHETTLVVSGGTTPDECFKLLSSQSLDWDRVLVTLSDERCVADGHAANNGRMVRENLLIDAAKTARFHSLELPTPAPFAAVLLGMGPDGHFASLFPDASNIGEGLDLAQGADTISIKTASSPYLRVSMPMARLLRTDCLLLLIFGEDKREVIDTPANTPIRYLLEQTITPVQIYWAP